MSDSVNQQLPVKPLSRSQKFSEGRLRFRQGLWPDIDSNHLWNRKSAVGFATIPRTMPLILVLMDSLSVGKPISTTYLDLWCRAFDESFVRLDKPHEMAFAAGFTTSRGPHIWAERLDILQRLGFIKLAPGAQGARSFALIFNPYVVLKTLKKTGKVSITAYNALLSAANAVGATDLDSIPTNKPAPPLKRFAFRKLATVA